MKRARHATSAIGREGERPSDHVCQGVLATPFATPLNQDTALWVSTAAIRARIGAWAYGQGAAGDRPGSAALRNALAVAASLAETAQALWRDPRERPLWAIDVPCQHADIARRSGLSRRDIGAALALLVDAGVLVHAGPERDAVRIVQEVLEPAPGVAALVWDQVRSNIEAAAAALPAPLAVIRELARVSGPVADPAHAPYVRYSVRDLELATQFGRSTVSDAVAALERAGLITVDARRGQTMRCALTGVAFGQEPPEDKPRAWRDEHGREATAISGDAAIAVATDAGASESVSGDTAPIAAMSSVLLGEFAGTPIYAPPGTPLVVECDAQGRWSCRVGPLLRLGPVLPKSAVD